MKSFFRRPLANTLGFFSFCEPSLGSTNLSRVSATEENLALIQEQPRGSRGGRPLRCRVDVRPCLPTHRSGRSLEGGGGADEMKIILRANGKKQNKKQNKKANYSLEGVVVISRAQSEPLEYIATSMSCSTESDEL